MLNNTDRLEQLSLQFDKRFRMKKTLNLVISLIIFLLGIIPIYLVFFVKEGIYGFRYLTVNGTIFTMTGAFIYVFVSLYEIITKNEITYIPVYFLRLSCAVSETVIMIVVIIGLFTRDATPIDEWDEVIIHAIMPVLMVASFLVNDSPIGKIRLRRLWNGTWFITVYGIISIIFYSSGLLPMSMIPYYFLNPTILPPIHIAFSIITIYMIAFTMAFILYFFNRKLSWLWFKGIGKKSNS